MNGFVSGKAGGRVLCTAIFYLLWVNLGIAQTNTWTNSASGYWEQPHWSLGELPGPNQDVFFTNAWQALAIGPSTVESAPDSLKVQSVTIAAPTNSVNVLLLNYAGVQNPLQLGIATSDTNGYLGGLLIGSNSTVTILGSALQVNNSIGIGTTERGAFSVGGTVNQGDYSQVSANFMRIGDIGPGVYNLTNGTVSISWEYVGSDPVVPPTFKGTFNQFGGTNSSYLHEGFVGEYNLYDGEFTGTLLMTGGGNFNQYGGSFSAEVDLVAGNYLLAGGNFSTAGLVIPDKTPPGPPPLAQASSFTQTDGTNSCSSLELFGAMPTSYYYGANGSYYLSNGTLLVAGTEAIDLACTFNQSGGIQTNAGISMTGAPSNHGPVPSYFNLTGGQILTPSVSVQSSTFTQSGGINQVSGTVLVTGGGFSYTPSGFYNLSGGLLSDSNATVYYAFQGGFVQGGGTHVVAQRLTVSGQPYEADGYVLTGGTLSAPVIQIDSGNSFRHAGGSVSNSDMLILSAGTWNDQTTAQQFGSLQLGANDSYSGTNSVLLLPPSANCVLQFADSSSMTWSNQHTLNIQNWNGSLNGGGWHRVVFGNSSHALTAQQLSQIFFINPDGVNGVFPARILSTGEIIPGRLLLARPGAGNLVLQWPGGTTLQSATNLSGPWQDLGSFTSPYTNELGQPAQFFRLRQ